MDDLQKLLSMCKCGVYLEVNEHRHCYNSVAQKFEELDNLNSKPANISPEMRAEMIARDTVVELQFYPRTPVCFHKVYHYDVAAALRIAVQALEERMERQSCNTATSG